jgi:hypothetical protein
MANGGATYIRECYLVQTSDLCTDLNCSIGSGMVWQLMLIYHVSLTILNCLFETYNKQNSASEREDTDYGDMSRRIMKYDMAADKN